VLGDCGQDVDGQLVSVWVIDSDEPGVHQCCDECEVAGQPIQLGNNQLGFVLLAGRYGLL
jgi:hypothetical protein